MGIISQLIMTKLQQTRKDRIHFSDIPSSDLIPTQEKAYTQGEIVNWFIEHVVSIKLLRGKDAADEAILVPKVIRKLVSMRKIAAFTPSLEKGKEESNEDFVFRKENLTILMTANSQFDCDN